MKYIREQAVKNVVKMMNRGDTYLERTDSNLPPPGSRVRRGPDWRYSDQQDQFMVGTLVGHVEDGKL